MARPNFIPADLREQLRKDSEKAEMTSARQVCEDLLQEALARGGTDNITLIVARSLPGEG